MSKTIQDLIKITLAALALTLLVWFPHLLSLPNFYGLDFSAGFNTIYRNFDGLEYVVIAKTLYHPDLIAAIPQDLPAIYYAAHFPGYALLISAFSPLLGFLKSMLFISLLFTVLSAGMFYLLLKDFRLTNRPLWLSLLFLLLPARWVVVHSVGSSEPVFIFFILFTVYFVMKFETVPKAYYIWLSAASGFLAQITRPPGLLLFFALSAYLIWKIFSTRGPSLSKRLSRSLRAYYPLLVIPLGLVTIFYWYSITYGDFWAYFKTGDNIHLTFPPYQVFNKLQYWVGDIWLEDLVYIFLASFLAGLLLLKQRLYPLAFFVLVYTIASASVAHRDISRYILPVFPFVLIAYEKILVSREFKIVMAILFWGIYLYAQNFLLSNTAPIPNLEVFN